MAEMGLSTRHVFSGAHVAHALLHGSGDEGTHFGCSFPSMRSSRTTVPQSIEQWKSRLTSSPSERARRLPTICRGGLDSEFFYMHEFREDKDGNTLVQMEKIQTELTRAVKTEDYSVAAHLRDQLRELQEDIEIAVRVANQKFYRAWERRDLHAMSLIWDKSETVQCVHPGCYCIFGHDMVMCSWETILNCGDEPKLKIELEHLRVTVKGNMGVVTCEEVMSSPCHYGRVVATNVFQKRGGDWFLVHHHGSKCIEEN
eukprot:TRINITY_DN1386_c0_g1_i1.p1 TRINITY_DN1386_c0_g1~~TRINITY_DN1386_c0_g1_i1.p1  ORF type:complete len:257 (+),score=41.92 TRINITY_DN1386_c0_g1_i1:77-847(+)